MYNWQGILYSVFGTTLYKDEIALGTVDGTARYSFVEILGQGWLVLGNGVRAYYTDGTTLSSIENFAPVYSGALLTGSTYEIIDAGTSDFTLIGAANNTAGTQFLATGPGDPLKTGTVALVAGSLMPAGTPIPFPVDVNFWQRVAELVKRRSPNYRPPTTSTDGPTLSVGATYQIRTLGTTDFTLMGAASNTVGEIFTATGVGSGTGTVLIANFPQNFVKGWAFLDGTLYTMDADANIFGTSTLSYGGIGGFDDPRLWDPLNMIVARIEPDKGVYLTKHLTYVIAMKQWTVEAFYDAGNPIGSPLMPVPGAQCLYGCASADSVQQIDGTLLWMTFNRTVSPQVARMDDLRATIISTPPIERLLDQVDFDNIFSWVLKHGGHRFYGLTVKSANFTIVYDLDQGLWYQWTDADGNYWPIVASGYNDANKHVLQHETNGKLYKTEGDYEIPNDDGVVVPVDIYTPNYDAGVDRRKTLKVMRFNCDQKSGSKLLVRHSDDDYQTWTNFREVNLSNKRPILTDCGTFYRRAWHFRHYANTPLRIKSIDLQMDIGTL
jgi:hypothetical protein